ncbi:MAG: Wzy polymerase domain-containing protein [Rhodocyclaceae bacterium]|nr:Wzy polymerase domain-containing protein [Rhodocyclaceae bacterium]
MASRAERFSLWMLGAMLCLPFLVPIHLAPISTFYPEWLACAFGLAATPAILARRGTAQWPAIGYLPLLLIAVLLVQTLGGVLPYAETGLLAMLYLLWATLAMTVAATLKERLGLEAVAAHLATWILAGAVINAAAGFFALNGVVSPWLMPLHGSRAIYGNLAQPNQFAHHIWLGIASALFLAARGRLATPVLTTLLVVLLPAAALAGSRTGLLYALWIVGAGHVWSGLGGTGRRVAVAVAYIACTILLPQWLDWGAASPAARTLSEASSGGGIRPTLFLVGWKMFLQAPWFGTGFGSFSRESFALAASLPDWSGTGEHAHNLVAQLLGELGIFAALGTCVAFFVWGRRAARERRRPETGWLVALAGIALLHSLVEYPLWYAYFLGVFAVVLALGDPRPRPLRLGRIALAAPVAMGGLVCFLLLRDYRELQALSVPIAARGTAEPFRERNQALARLRTGSLLKPYADLALSAAMIPSRAELAAKTALCRRTLRFAPTAPPVFTCALIYRLAGADRDAETLWMQALRASPGHVPDYRSWLEDTLSATELLELQPLVGRAAGPRSP